MCYQFDKEPTKELCDSFLKEAEHKLELAQENAKSSEAKGIIERLQLSFYDLRKTKRIYNGLQKQCAEVK